MNKTSAAAEDALRIAYKNIINPAGEKRNSPVSNRLATAALSGALTTGFTIGISKALHAMAPKIFSGKISAPATAVGALSAATLGYFHDNLRNATLDFHQHKDDAKLKKAMAPYHFSSNNLGKRSQEVIDTFTKSAGLGKVIGNTFSTAAKTIGGGLKFGGNPTRGEKMTRFVTKGTALVGLAYGGSKAYHGVTAPRSESNYTTFLRNNIVSGGISPNEITDREKTDINELGMR